MSLFNHIRTYRKTHLTVAVIAVAATFVFRSMDPTQQAVSPTGQVPGVVKVTTTAGDGVTFAQKGDQISMLYSGWLAKDYPDGPTFDSTSNEGRGDFNVQVGVGGLIRGWDEGICQDESKPELGMSLGEKATLRIQSDYGYGARGFGKVIPPDSDLIFDVYLKAINGKQAPEHSEE